jgi:hypothetical protein
MADSFDPSSTAVAELNRWLQSVPFVPFRIVTSSGRAYEVPTPDHITITRITRRVFVDYDDGSGAVVSPLHITAIEPLPGQRPAA